MPDYHAVLQVELTITAKSREQACDRAARIEQWLTLNPPKKQTWAHDIEFVSVEQIEPL